MATIIYVEPKKHVYSGSSGHAEEYYPYYPLDDWPALDAGWRGDFPNHSAIAAACGDWEGDQSGGYVDVYCNGSIAYMASQFGPVVYLRVSYGSSAQAGYAYFDIPAEPVGFISVASAIYTIGETEYDITVPWGTRYVASSTRYPTPLGWDDCVPVIPPAIWDPNVNWRGAYGGNNSSFTCSTLTITYATFAVTTEEATGISLTSATLNGSSNELASCYFEYEIYDADDNLIAGGNTASQNVDGAFSASLSLPNGWYEVWFKAVGIYKGTTYYGGLLGFDGEAIFTITTLPATEVWATGAMIHGMIKNDGVFAGHAYAGFQWGLNSDVSAEVIHWSYSGSYGHGNVPIQATISGLLPDRTYYYRACFHEGTPPMDEGNIFGDTLSFGGPISIFGEGWEYVTAKKAEDDVSKLAAGRYYMDKSGNFVYESAKHRDV